jgi:RHS repeat-associated protein
LGNWKTFTKDGTPETRIANAQNEYTSVGGASLGYSANGNLVTDEQGRTFEYDAWNRLIIARSSGGVLLASYDYDGLNRRITEQVSGDGISDASMSPVKDMFYSSQWQVLEERLRVAGAVGTVVEARFVWSPVYIDAMVLRDRGAERVYALQDGNWNTTALIAAAGVPGKAAGEVIQRMVYNPYGEVFRLNPDWTEQFGTPLVPWQHLFQGLKFTEATGLGYVRNRDYSPSLGRFIELDPIGFSAGDNNWYRFVGNGPVGSVDPSGLDGYWCCVGKVLLCEAALATCVLSVPGGVIACAAACATGPWSCVICIVALPGTVAAVCEYAYDKCKDAHDSDCLPF